MIHKFSSAITLGIVALSVWSSLALPMITDTDSSDMMDLTDMDTKPSYLEERGEGKPTRAEKAAAKAREKIEPERAKAALKLEGKLGADLNPNTGGHPAPSNNQPEAGPSNQQAQPSTQHQGGSRWSADTDDAVQPQSHWSAITQGSVDPDKTRETPAGAEDNSGGSGKGKERDPNARRRRSEFSIDQLD